MRFRLIVAAAALLAATSAHAVVVDTYTRTDGPIVTDSLGDTEIGGIHYVERNNNASGSTADGTAQITDNKLVITGANSTTMSGNLITGGAYLNGFDAADVRVGLDLSFELATDGPSGIVGNISNQFNNTFLLMLRSRVGQNFGTTAADQAGLVAIEIVPNGGVQVREQRGAANLVFVRNQNPFTLAPVTREPLAGILPTTYGSGPFDTNGNGYLDAGETIRLEAELIGTSLNLFVNGALYGDPISLALTSAVAGQANGVGLHKNRIGGTLLVGVNPIVDNLFITSIPEPNAILMASIAATILTGCRKFR